MMPMTTIDINQLLTDYVSSLPMTGSTSAPNWNDFISSIMSNKNNVIALMNYPFSFSRILGKSVKQEK